MTTTRNSRWLGRAGSALVAGTMVAGLTACSVAGGDGAGGESVPANASKQEYIEAFAELDPIELTIQSNQGPGIGYSVPIERYVGAVEEWSGGKINFDIVYSGAIAPVQESGRAMADGLVDMSFWSYTSTRESFPVSSLVQSTFLMNESTPLAGSLELVATGVEQSAEIEELRAELEDQGLHPLLPVMPNAGSTLLCTGGPVTTMSEAAGRSVAPTDAADAEEYKAMGFSIVNIPFAELFDALQRGVVDCKGGAETSMLLSGILEVTDNWSFSPSTALSAASSAFDISKGTWDSLPLPAQQLLYDRLDAFLAGFTEEFSARVPAESLREAEKQNVQLREFGPDLMEVLQAHQQGVLDEVAEVTFDGVEGSRVVENGREYTEKWRGIVDELGLNPGVSREEFPAWLEANPVDLQPYAERLMSEAMAKNRPA